MCYWASSLRRRVEAAPRGTVRMNFPESQGHRLGAMVRHVLQPECIYRDRRFKSWCASSAVGHASRAGGRALVSQARAGYGRLELEQQLRLVHSKPNNAASHGRWPSDGRPGSNAHEPEHRDPGWGGRRSPQSSTP